MKILWHLKKWFYAAKAQNTWFSGKAGKKPWEINPELDFIPMDWVLSFDRIKQFFKDNIVNNKWITDGSIRLCMKIEFEMQNYKK